MIKFDLVGKEVIRKIKLINTVDALEVRKHATYSFLKVLDHQGLLPKGYLTRVTNGHIKFDTCYRKCIELHSQSNYRVAIKQINANQSMLALIDKCIDETLINITDLTKEA